MTAVKVSTGSGTHWFQIRRYIYMYVKLSICSLAAGSPPFLLFSLLFFPFFRFQSLLLQKPFYYQHQRVNSPQTSSLTLERNENQKKNWKKGDWPGFWHAVFSVALIKKKGWLVQQRELRSTASKPEWFLPELAYLDQCLKFTSFLPINNISGICTLLDLEALMNVFIIHSIGSYNSLSICLDYCLQIGPLWKCLHGS